MKAYLIRNKLNIEIILGSIVIAAIFCIPFLNGYIRVGADTAFHMNRIESLKESIENGIFYPYVYTEQNYGFGYGTPSFYCQLFLYPAVLLRFLGLGIAQTWRVYIFLIILCISLSMAYASRSILSTNKIGIILLSSFLCIFNTFLISRVHQRAALGELLALIFIPLIIKETHNLLNSKNNNWLKMGLAFSCLLLSHNISFVLTVTVFGITILCNIKKLISNKRILIVIKAACFAILLSAFFLFPMFEQLSFGKYNINGSTSNGASLTGMSLYQYFDFYTIDGGSIKLALNLFLLIMPAFVLFRNDRQYFYLAVTAYILIICSSIIFPWKYISIFNFIQFPSRLLIVALPYLSITSVSFFIDNSYKSKVINISVMLVLIVSLITTSISLLNILNHYGAINNSTTREQIKTGVGLYNKEDINFSYNIPEMSGNEYLPYGFYGDFYDRSLVPQLETSDQKVNILYKNYNEQNFKLTIKNDTTCVFPKTYYKGYVVSIYKDGNYIETLKTEPDIKYNAFVSVTLDDSYKAQEIQLQLVYKNTRTQKISIAISLATLISTIGYLIYKKKKSI